VFAAADALDRLAAFVAERGARFYRLPVNAGTVTLRREAWTVPTSLPFGDDEVVPLGAGESLAWRVVAST
jgi:dihydroorotase